MSKFNHLKTFERYGEVVYCPDCDDILVYNKRAWKCIRCHRTLSEEKYNKIKRDKKSN